jgi:hypothetical protein
MNDLANKNLFLLIAGYSEVMLPLAKPDRSW